jgi:integrase
VRLSRFGAWADLPVEEITRDMVKAELKRLVASPKDDGLGLTKENANKHLIALKAVFNYAIKQERLMVNPTNGIEPFPEDNRKVKFIPEKGQFSRILLAAKELDRAYLTIAAYTAGRISEINKLTWEDVRWDNGRGRCAVCLWTRKKKHGDIKSRWVPVKDKVKAALEYAYAHRTKNSPWVFTNPDMVIKYPNDPSRWRYIYRSKFFKRLCDQAGVPRMGYHNLRHLASSSMAAGGAKLTEIQNFLGHERATTTNLYLQSLGFNYLEDAAEMMDLETCADLCADEESAQNVRT